MTIVTLGLDLAKNWCAAAPLCLGIRRTQPLSHMAMTMLLGRMGCAIHREHWHESLSTRR